MGACNRNRPASMAVLRPASMAVLRPVLLAQPPEIQTSICVQCPALPCPTPLWDPPMKFLIGSWPACVVHESLPMGQPYAGDASVGCVHARQCSRVQISNAPA